MSTIEIKVPNIGDFKDVEVIEVLVLEGQEIKKNDPLITIESDKSSVEIPSNFNGKIKNLKIKVGDKVSEGDSILILEDKTQTKKKVEENKIIKKEFKKIQESKPEIKQNFTNNTALNDLLNETAMGDTNTESGNAPVSLSQPFSSGAPLPMDTTGMSDAVANAVTRDYSGLMKAIAKKK